GDAECGSQGEGIFFQVPPLEPVFEATNGDLRIRLEILNPVSQFACSDTITINAPPETPFLMVSDTIFCEGDSLLLMTESQDSLRWIRNNSVFERGFSPELWVSEAGFYRVEAITTESLCVASSNTVFVEKVRVNIPQISFDGDSLLMVISPQEELQYEWFNQEDSLVGTGSTFLLERSGEYYAVAVGRETDCRSENSSSIDFIATSLENELTAGSVKVFPNPFREEIQLSWAVSNGPLKEIMVYDLMGKRMEIPNSQQSQNRIDTHLWSEGLYTLVLRFEKGISIHKVLKKS
ncbi:MAG: T9SS type A sorting domain-containing protein, partial [Bacteroidota bacterium]